MITVDDPWVHVCISCPFVYGEGMDALSTLLRGVRADGVLLSRPAPRPPWGMQVESRSSLMLCSPLRGRGWLMLPGQEEPLLLRAGDTAVVRGPLAFTFTDAPEPQDEWPCSEVCRPGPQTVTLADQSEAQEASTSLLVVEFPVGGEVGRRLLDALPPVLVVPADPSCEATLEVIGAEVAAERPGQQVVLERLLEWVLVCTLRAWFDAEGREAPAWYVALADPVVGPALRAMHGDHARSWTVAALARTARVSRAALAKRFTELVGEPPLTYLTGWRMAVAADLLVEPGATVGEVARRVGYADQFGFSAAFKRTRGVSPSAFRRASTTP